MFNKYYPMNSAVVLDLVLDIYNKSFFKQALMALVFFVIFLVVFFIFALIGIIVLIAGVVGAGFDGAFGIGTIIAIAAFILAAVLILSIYSALTATGAALITKHTFYGEKCNEGRVLENSFKKVFIAILAALAQFVVFIPGAIIAALLVYFYAPLIMDFGVAGFMPTVPLIAAAVILIILIAIVFLVCATITILSINVAIFEGKLFFGAVMRSFQLVKPDFMKLMGLMLIWALIIWGITYSIELLFAVGQALAAYFLPAEAAGAVFLIFLYFGGFISLAVSIAVTTPLLGIFNTIVYISQRIKLEGLDIELNLNALEAGRKNDDDDIRASDESGVE